MALMDWYPYHRRAFIEDFFYIEDRNTQRRIPFKFRPVQINYWERMNAGARRLVVVKARQAEVSSIVEADYTSYAMLTPGVSVVCFVQKPEEITVPKHLNRVKLFAYSVPQEIRPRIVKENASTIAFGFKDTADKPEQVSEITYISAGSPDAPRGGTYHYAHLTEYDSWDISDAEAIFRSLEGLPDASVVVVESSPKHADGPLRRMFKNARAGLGNFEPVVYPWFWVPEYRVRPGHPRSKPEWRGDFTPSATEALLMHNQGLEIDQIRWRRRMIDAAASLFGDADQPGEEALLRAEEEFLIEYLESEETCWAMTGTPAMPGYYLAKLLREAVAPLPMQGIPGLRVWLPPETGDDYVVMGDPAEGLTTSHLSAAVVRRVRDWAHCATFRAHTPPGEFGGVLVSLGHLYNNALIGWERNNHGWGVDEKVKALNYPYVYLFHGIGDQRGDDRRGFPTTKWNKPSLVTGAHAEMTAERWHSWDSELIGQYRQLQDLGDGRYDTSVLDMAMADMLCLAARLQGGHNGRHRRSIGNERKYHIPKYLQRVRPRR